jgi:predicted metal-binding protein
VKENSIEETIKQLKLILKIRKEQKEIIECAGGSCMNCDPDIKALSKSIEILSDYKRVLKENEELLEVRVSTSAHNRILELEKENEELKERITSNK